MTIARENFAFDAAGTTETSGFWTTKARFARPGIQEYTPQEYVNWPSAEKLAGRKARVLRPEAVVFDPAAMKSFENVPISVEHSGGILDPSNVQREIVGAAGAPVVREGDTLVVPATLYTEDAISGAQSKVRKELSAGYLFDVEYSPGVDEKYGEYDYVMTTWRGNHITLTREGKAGPDFYIGDKKMPDEKKEQNGEGLVYRALDSISYGFTALTAQVFDRVLGERDAARAEVETLKKSTLSDEEIEKRVDERFSIFDSARKIVDEKALAGKKIGEMVALVVEAAFPALDTKGKELSYLMPLFDAAVKNGKPADEDGERALENGTAFDSKQGKTASAIARKKYIAENSGRRK